VSTPAPASSPESAPQGSAPSPYCDERGRGLTGDGGCKRFSSNRNECVKHYQNPGGNDPKAYGTGHECLWHSEASSDSRCKNDGNACEVLPAPAYANLPYCSDLVTKATSDCKKLSSKCNDSDITSPGWNNGCSDYNNKQKQKCKNRFQFVGGNENALGATNVCKWTGSGSNVCTASGDQCLRATAPNGEAGPISDTD
jgi:hypothetical protein